MDSMQVLVFNLRAESACGPRRAQFDIKLVFTGGLGTLVVKNFRLMKRAQAGDGHLAGYWVAPPATRKDRGPGFHNFSEIEGPWTTIMLTNAVDLLKKEGFIDSWTPAEVPFYPERPEDAVLAKVASL